MCDPYAFSWESKHQASEEIKKSPPWFCTRQREMWSPTKDASPPTDTLMLVCPCFKKVACYGGLRRWCDLDTWLLLLHAKHWHLFCSGGNLVCLIAFHCIRFLKIPACRRLWESCPEIDKLIISSQHGFKAPTNDTPVESNHSWFLESAPFPELISRHTSFSSTRLICLVINAASLTQPSAPRCSVNVPESEFKGKQTTTAWNLRPAAEACV